LRLKKRRITATATSKSAAQEKRWGIATATMVEDFCDPAMAIALAGTRSADCHSRRGISRLDLKLYRRNSGDCARQGKRQKRIPSPWNKIATTQVTRLENSADPAARHQGHQLNESIGDPQNPNNCQRKSGQPS